MLILLLKNYITFRNLVRIDITKCCRLEVCGYTGIYTETLLVAVYTKSCKMIDQKHVWGVLLHCSCSRVLYVYLAMLLNSLIIQCSFLKLVH